MLNELYEEHIETICRSNVIALYTYKADPKVFQKEGNSRNRLLLLFMIEPILYVFAYQANKLCDSFMCIFSVIVGQKCCMNTYMYVPPILACTLYVRYVYEPCCKVYNVL